MQVEKTEKILLLIIFLYSVSVAIVNPAFLNPDTAFDLIRSASRDIILAMGLLLIMMSGGIDISFMAIALFGGYVSTYIFINLGISNIYLTFLLSSSIGVLLGLFNACLISYLKLPAFIITLGTMNLFHGFMALLVGTKTYGGGMLPLAYSAFGSGTLFQIETEYGAIGLTTSVIPVVLVIITTWFVIYKTMIGRGLIAIGNSEESARRLGFNPFTLRLFAYGYMGALSGIAGITYITQVNAAYPDKLIGEELMVVAGAVIGGTSISGGKGKILGVILGIVIIYLLKSTLIFIGLSSSWNNFFVGIILVLSLSLTALQEKIKNKKLLRFKVESR